MCFVFVFWGHFVSHIDAPELCAIIVGICCLAFICLIVLHLWFCSCGFAHVTSLLVITRLWHLRFSCHQLASHDVVCCVGSLRWFARNPCRQLSSLRIRQSLRAMCAVSSSRPCHSDCRRAAYAILIALTGDTTSCRGKIVISSPSHPPATDCVPHVVSRQ